MGVMHVTQRFARPAGSMAHTPAPRTAPAARTPALMTASTARSPVPMVFPKAPSRARPSSNLEDRAPCTTRRACLKRQRANLLARQQRAAQRTHAQHTHAQRANAQRTDAQHIARLPGNPRPRSSLPGGRRLLEVQGQGTSVTQATEVRRRGKKKRDTFYLHNGSWTQLSLYSSAAGCVS